MCAYLYCVVCVYVSVYYMHVHAYINVCVYIYIACMGKCLCLFKCCMFSSKRQCVYHGFSDGFVCVGIYVIL